MATSTLTRQALIELRDTLILSVTPAGRVAYGDKIIEYHTPEQRQQIIGQINKQIAILDGNYSTRVYAKQGGRA